MEQVHQLFAAEVVFELIDFFAKPCEAKPQLEFTFEDLQAPAAGVIDQSKQLA